MSQDTVADALNEIMNAKKAGKKNITLKKHSKLLRNILQIAKEQGYIDFNVSGNEIKIDIKKINEIKAIKPRFTVTVSMINKYSRRYLPARDFGFVIISTNQGLMNHYEAIEKKIGGCLVAYMF